VRDEKAVECASPLALWAGDGIQRKDAKAAKSVGLESL